MKIRDIFHETFSALRANKTRSGLTILGIVIGIASVIAMTAIGTGAKNSVSASIEGLGSNLLTIFPGVIQPGRGIVSSGRGSGQNLKKEDVAALEEVPGITLISPEDSRRFQIVAESGNNTNTTVTGVSATYQTVHNINLSEGNFITEANDRAIGRQAVLGSSAATDLFGEEDPLGAKVRINNVNFTVVGVTASKGGSGFGSVDDMIFVPLSTMQKILSGADYYSSIAVSVENKDIMPQVQEDVTATLLERHHVDEADFSVISQADILGTLSTVIDTFTIFLASIASISLLVGGIGIMNMMLTTVTERTKEIGLRKAIGAKRSDISKQFLVESVMLTFVGGVIGVFLGWLIAFGVTKTGLVQAAVAPGSVLLAFGVSAIIGIVFGYYPAIRAAKLNPIDALRYE
jgi:putative ABC transport system permease protein